MVNRVIVIPAHLADEIANEAFEMTAFEDFVAEEVRKGRGIFGLYPATDEKTLTDTLPLGSVTKPAQDKVRLVAQLDFTREGHKRRLYVATTADLSP